MASSNLCLISLVSLATMIGVSLTGCGLIPEKVQKKLYGDYSIGELKYGQNNDEYSSLIDTVKTTYKVPDTCINGSSIPNALMADQCKQKRQVIVGDLMGISNSMCEWHKQTIWGNDAAFNMITGTFTNIFSGAATVVSGGAGQALLAALALFSNATRSLGNETVYKNVLIPAVVSKINDSRKTKLGIIKQNIIESGSQSYNEYPINVALLDVIDYHQSCSFMHGLLRAIEEGSRDRCPDQIAKAEERLEILRMQMQREKEIIKTKRNQALSEEDALKDTIYKQLANRYQSISMYADNLQKSCNGEAATTPGTKEAAPPNADRVTNE